MKYDVTGNLINRAIPSMAKDETCYFICHCGWVDYDLFQYTSLTLRRLKDLSAMCDPQLKDFIEKEGIELITYRDLK